MTDIITELEQATEGSRELDFKIHEFVTGVPRSQLRDHMAALSYTTSLDAKIPGEDIVLVSEQVVPEGQPRKWMALQRYPKGVYGRAALAHTEPLARRLAALLA